MTVFKDKIHTNDWKTYKIKDIGKVVTGSTPSMKVPSNYGNYIPWVTAVDCKGVYIRSTKKMLSKSGLKSARLVPEGSVLVSCIASIGLNAIAGADLTTNQQINSIIVDQMSFDSRFVYYLMCAQRETMQRIAGKTAVPIINKSEFENFQIKCPDLMHQRYIADCLSSWDQALEKVDQLIEAKTKLKKALSQKLLTGQIRFPGFGKPVSKIGEIPEGWNTYLIDDIAYEVSKRNTSNIDLPVILCSKHRGFVSSLEFFNKQVFSCDKTKYKVIGYWQFGFPTNHVEEGSIGLYSEKTDSLLSPIYIVFETDRARVYPPYLFYMLKTDKYKQLFSLHTEASVDRRGNLRWSGFSKISILLPPLGEQVMISRFVSLLQDEIDNLTRFKEHVARQQDAILSDLLLVRSPNGN